MENPELNDLRTQINHIDEQLLQLIVQRFDVVREVGRVKQTAHLPIKDAAREQAVLNRLKAKVDDEALQQHKPFPKLSWMRPKSWSNEFEILKTEQEN